MATQLRIKRGTTNANAPSGLTAGEMAINLFDKKLYVGGTGGTNVIFLDSTSSVGLGTANTFTQLNTFSAGISASGATFSGPIQIPINTAPAIKIGNHASKNLTLGSIGGGGEIVQTGASNSQLNIRQENGGIVSIGDYTGTLNSTYINVDDVNALVNLSGTVVQTDCNSFVVNAVSSSTFTGTVTVPTPINATDAANKTYVDSTGVQTFNGLTGTATGVGTAVAGTGISVSGATGAVTITNTGVQTFNGLTGAVTGITAGGVNTFTALNTFSAGISASGATFSSPIISTGYQISSGGIQAKTASYSLVAADNGKIITMNVASANTLTVPASLDVGFNCTVIQIGAGQTTITASSTTLNSYQGYLKISGQHGSASIVGYTSNVYNVAGNLSA